MKKFLGILAIAGTLVACDNTASSEQRIKDSTDSANKANATTPTVTPTTTDTGMNTGTDTGMNRTGTDTTVQQ